MEQTVLDFLERESMAYSPDDIAGVLSLSQDEVHLELDSLLAQGLVALTKRGKYAAPRALGLTTARVAALRSGSLQARPLAGGPGMPIHPVGALRAMADDIVLVRPSAANAYGNRPCEVIFVARRAHETFSAVLISDSPAASRDLPRHASKKQRQKAREEEAVTYPVRPHDARITCPVRVQGDLKGAKPGDMVVLETITWPEYDKPLIAKVLRVMGEAEQLQVQLKAIAEDHGFITQFGQEALELAAQFPSAPEPADLESRADLRDTVLFTIDGADAKDFDDAVSLAKLPGGAWELGVHIADVSHYVLPRLPLDQEAVKRGTSLYLPGFTLPMLPEKLSNGLCSLMPNVDRLAMSLTMTIENGRVQDHRLSPSVIHSRARLTYEAVNRLFNNEENDVPESLHDTLRDMLSLSQDLRRERFKRGAIDLDIPETGFTLTPEGEPLDVHPRERGEAEKLIEDFMLAANETVAELARHTDLAFVYRVHEKPDPDKLHALELFLASLNIRVHLGPEPHPGQLQDLLTKTEQSPAAGVIRQVMLRSLRRAVYSHRPDGHYALAARDYCHFTSPIRRYPDLIVHRMLKSLLAGNPAHASDMEKRMTGLSEQCSSQEYAATTAEREADDLLKARYMSRHIGEIFSGIVSGVTPWGFYVTLSNTVEGLVPIGTLEDYYEYDEVSSTLTGSHTGKVIRLGQRTRVRVSRVDTARREIDFSVEERG